MFNLTKLILCVTLFSLVSCVLQEEGDANHVVYIGDSIPCRVYDSSSQYLTYAELAGFDNYCTPGIAAVEIEYIPKGYPVTIIGLGTNDAFKKIDLERFRSHYKALTEQVEGELWCVLPLQIADVTGEYRAIVGDICGHRSIDLWSCGFESRAKDKVHGNWKDHQYSYDKCFKYF